MVELGEGVTTDRPGMPATRPGAEIVALPGGRAGPAPERLAVLRARVGRCARLGAHPSAGEVVQAALARSVAALLEIDRSVAPDTDPEDVHRCRVATRRLRSDLRTFAPLLDPAWSAALRERLRDLGALFGAVRDADVLAARLEGELARLDEVDRAAARRVVGRLGATRERALAALRCELGDERFEDRLEELVSAATAPPLRGPVDRPADEVLPRLVRRPWRRLRREATRLERLERPTDPELHRARILAKRCRYAAEATAPALGRPARRFARAVSELQDVLGEHQDAVVAEAWLREAGTRPPATEAFAAGLLAVLARADAETARAAWVRRWHRVRARHRDLPR